MEVKVAALENEMANLKVTLAKMQSRAEENQERLITLLTWGKRTDSPEKSVEKHTKIVTKLQGDSLDEFRKSVKKIELPMFTGEDPAGWIARAEVYFQVQETSPEVRASLAQLCMEGPTIHFFNSLLDGGDELTWEQFKGELLERYGGVSDGNVFEQLSSLQQESGVEEYIQEFERLTAQVP